MLAHAQITESLDTSTNDEGHIDSKGARWSKDIPELHPMISFAWLSEHGVLSIAPVHGATIHNDTSNCRSMASDPLCAAFDHNIGTVLERFEDVATHAERIVAAEGGEEEIMKGN